MTTLWPLLGLLLVFSVFGLREAKTALVQLEAPGQPVQRTFTISHPGPPLPRTQLPPSLASHFFSPFCLV